MRFSFRWFAPPGAAFAPEAFQVGARLPITIDPKVIVEGWLHAVEVAPDGSSALLTVDTIDQDGELARTISANVPGVSIEPHGTTDPEGENR